MNPELIYPLQHAVGLTGIAVGVFGLVAIIAAMHIANYIVARLVLIVIKIACILALWRLVTLEQHILGYAYIIVLISLLIVHGGALLLAVAFADWSRGAAPDEEIDPLIRRGIKAEKSLDWPEAIKAYEEYLEDYEDAAVRTRLAEALIKVGDSKRAISVLTVAFGEAEKPKRQILIGIRLAELLLVAQRDPVAARTQLEQVKEMFKGTEHEDYVERLSEQMKKNVAEGKYLKRRPEGPGGGT